MSYMSTAGNVVKYTNMKIEKGTIATPWCPNVKDAAANLHDYNKNIEYDRSGYLRDGDKKCLPKVNYFKNTSFSSTTSWFGVNESTIKTISQNNRASITGTKGTGNYLFGTTSTLSHTAGTNQTAVFTAQIYSPVAQTIHGGVWINSSGWQGCGSVSFIDNQLAVGWNFVRANVSITSTTYSGDVIFAVGCSDLDNPICMYHPKLEVGSQPTEWIPHTTDSDYAGYTSGLNIKAEGDSARYESTYVFTDSCNQYIVRDHLPFLSNAITMSCWIRQKSYTSYSTSGDKTLAFIMSQGRDYLDTTAANTYGINIVSDNGTLTFRAGINIANSGVKIDLNKWYHVACTWDGTNIKIYVNGQLKNTTATSRVLWTNNASKFAVGKMAYGYNTTDSFFPFVGNISDARIYATTLSDKDILELYEVGASIDNDGNMYGYELKEI